MPDFDAAAAKAAGYSDDEIAKVQRGIAAARAAGYSDAEIAAHLSGAAKGPEPTTLAPAATPPTAVSGAVTEDPGWSLGRIARDLGHGVLLGGRVVSDAATGLVNTPMALIGLADKILPEPSDITALREKYAAQPESPANWTGLFPRVNLGPEGEPKNPAEAYGTSFLTGTTSALLGGAAARVPAILGAAGKEIAEALPNLLRGSVVGGGVPAVATEAANRNLDLDSLGPRGKALAELGIGAASAMASHAMLKGDPVGAVAATLGDSRNADEAGDAVAAGAQNWRKGLSAKLEELKAPVFGPVKEPDVYAGDSTHDTNLFGKVPLHSATVDNSGLLGAINAVAHEGGVYHDAYGELTSKMPDRLATLMDNIALSNNPITASPRVVRPKGLGTTDPDFNLGPVIEGEQAGTPFSMRGKPVVPAGARNEHTPAAAPPNFTGPYTSEPPPNAGGSSSPILSTQPETGYRPDFVMAKAPFEAAKAGEAPAAAPAAAPSPLVNEPTPPPPPPKGPRRNARGQFVRKGYGIEPATEAGPPAVTPPQPGSALVAPEAPPQPGGAAKPDEAPTSPPPNPNPVGPARTPPGPPPTEDTYPESHIIGFKAPLRDAMQLRSAFGEWLANPKLMPKGIDEAHVKAYYAALSGDIAHTMSDHGAGEEWNNYNTEATKLYHAGNLLSKFASDVNPERNDVAGGKAVDALWRGMSKDSSEIENLRQHVPEAADEVASAFLRAKPEQWGRLPEASQRALVPNPFDRLTLSLHAARKESLTEQAKQVKESALSGSATYALSDLLMPHGQAEGSTSFMSPAAWAAAAAMVPSVVRGLGAIRRNPRMLKIPAMGAVAGRAGAEAGGNDESAPSSPLLRSPGQ